MKSFRDRGKFNQVLQAKLYLLAIGILILLALLTWGVGKKIEQAEQEPKTETKTKDEQEADPEETDTEEAEVLAYNGNIRVLLKTDGFAKELHETVTLSSASGADLGVYPREGGEILDSGNELSFAWEEDTLFLNGEPLAEAPECLRIGGTEGSKLPEEERICVSSLTRNGEVPAYEGSMEIWPKEGGFYLVNEVPFETYLKYVVPSEMPSGYSIEALKAQAVCARTYAYKELSDYDYPACEAHVDDSVRYQVYNNTGTADSTNQAVEETAGCILTSGGNPITAYYFSTSCGATGNEEIWWEGNAELTPYLTGKLVNETGEAADLTSEEAFSAFLEQENTGCYDGDVSWYRWEASIDLETLSDNLNGALKGRYEANPEAVLTKKGSRLVSREIDTIGKLRGIDVLERNAGGAIEKIRVRGSRRTIEASTEYNVRALLNVQGTEITRQDGSKTAGTALLPSACMVITPVFDGGGELWGYRFFGGGYGHGTGLSQNGANGMAKQGKTFEEILRFFYTNVDLTAIGDL